MRIENNKFVFDNKREEKDFITIKDYFLSFYQNKKEIKELFNNVYYYKDENNSKFIDCFKKEFAGILYTLPLEYPQYKKYVKRYNKKQEESLLDYVMRHVSSIYIKNAKNWGIIN